VSAEVIEEGEVGAGDEIVKAGDARERITVAEINALLYLPNHPGGLLEGALRIEALSPGWRGSCEALLRARRMETRDSYPKWPPIQLQRDFTGSR
jgi:MOSC domain-containing protein YiiM